MPTPVTKAAARAARHVPGLRRIPILRLLVLAELVVIARDHVAKLSPAEWRRLVVLLRIGRGRPANLSPADRQELEALVAKAEPRLFVGQAVERLSPIALPKRLVYGPAKRLRR
jgi:hypothetical protein